MVEGSFGPIARRAISYHPLMATLLAHITVRPGAEAEFEALARTLYEQTHATETGVLRYEYWRGMDERSYYTLLSFTDHRAFIAHQTSDHHESASPQLGRLIESLRLEWLDPVAGSSELPATAMQPAPEGATDLTVAYTDRFVALMAPWWEPLRE